jgi:hypothetical protein
MRITNGFGVEWGAHPCQCNDDMTPGSLLDYHCTRLFNNRTLELEDSGGYAYLNHTVTEHCSLTGSHADYLTFQPSWPTATYGSDNTCPSCPSLGTHTAAPHPTTDNT